MPIGTNGLCPVKWFTVKLHGKSAVTGLHSALQIFLNAIKIKKKCFHCANEAF